MHWFKCLFMICIIIIIINIIMFINAYFLIHYYCVNKWIFVWNTQFKWLDWTIGGQNFTCLNYKNLPRKINNHYNYYDNNNKYFVQYLNKWWFKSLYKYLCISESIIRCVTYVHILELYMHTPIIKEGWKNVKRGERLIYTYKIVLKKINMSIIFK